MRRSMNCARKSGNNCALMSASQPSGGRWMRLSYRGKKTRRASEGDPKERAKFERTQQTLPVERLVFLDEFAINLAMLRTHGRAPIGERVEVSEPFNRGENISTI